MFFDGRLLKQHERKPRVNSGDGMGRKASGKLDVCL
jgi:hypothetical protein